MSTVGDVLKALETIAPQRFAFPFDKVGLQLGDPSWTVRKASVSLDWSEGLCDFMDSNGSELAICHHPLIWEPLTTVTSNSRSGQIALRLLTSKRAFIACHTNWDSAVGGVNDALASRLGLKDVRAFGSASDVKQLKLVTFVPKEHAERLIDALSMAGAGSIGLYERCAFLSAGEGTFRPQEGSAPTIGSVGNTETVEEVRVEMVLRAEHKVGVINALKENHPYDEPAFDLYPIEPLPEQPAGRIGELPAGMPLAEFCALVDVQLGTKTLAWGAPKKTVRSVAVVGGAADGEWKNAKSAGADVFVTGEVKQNVALDAAESGIAILSSGHFATEQPGMEALTLRLRDTMPSVDWSLYVPEIGSGGRAF
ncbi:MAG: Nif3-like dinuclear metal center hexameric protein [Fimbriimonadaceae bacterium]|nr:Nif3-like dinuclear metal center hexameric protein [Fimbriimonadaceae bacterium]